MLEQLLQGTGAIDAVITLTLVEGMVLSLYRLGTGRGPRLCDFGLNLISGLMLMLALRSNIAAWGLAWTTAFLAAAGVMHASDIWLRWKRQQRGWAARPF